jgi:hypothetical protein
MDLTIYLPHFWVVPHLIAQSVQTVYTIVTLVITEIIAHHAMQPQTLGNSQPTILDVFL